MERVERKALHNYGPIKAGQTYKLQYPPRWHDWYRYGALYVPWWVFRERWQGMR